MALTSFEMPTKPEVWLERALDDHRRAKYQAAASEFGRACFSCRHMAEKALFAFMLANNKKPPKTHSLTRLTDKALKPFPNLRHLHDAARILDQYYIGELPDDRKMKRQYSHEDAMVALSVADEILGELRPMILERIEEIP